MVARVLQRLPEPFRFWRLPPTAWDARWARDAAWAFLARTPDEVALLLPRSAPAPPGARAALHLWQGWRVAGVLDFALVGILAGLTQPLAQARIPVLAVSTFDTDYLFTPRPQAAAAESAWRAAGWHIAPWASPATSAESATPNSPTPRPKPETGPLPPDAG